MFVSEKNWVEDTEVSCPALLTPSSHFPTLHRPSLGVDRRNTELHQPSVPYRTVWWPPKPSPILPYEPATNTHLSYCLCVFSLQRALCSGNRTMHNFLDWLLLSTNIPFYFLVCFWIFILWVCVFCLHVCGPGECLQMSGEGIRTPGTIVMDSCEPACGCWVPYSRSLEEQPELLIDIWTSSQPRNPQAW